ncbi:growth-regulating factor 4-like [Panicum miliaceum]|uniref:Growth-regulating factor 4-like n=1 Tax=Panicum miliaceum TaxID=4540 RepID=A0A3L6RMB8_PANMI|nr:growth-regulating factor 4-like [Panicum miliaceum]
MENQWRLPPSQNSPFPLSSYPQLGALSGLGSNTVSSLSKMDRQPLSFLGSDFGGVDSVKQENQTLRPFFDEWPKARDSWPGLSDDNTNLASFPATQLSISIPMASSDFSVASSQSPNGRAAADRAAAEDSASHPQPSLTSRPHWLVGGSARPGQPGNARLVHGAPRRRGRAGEPTHGSRALWGRRATRLGTRAASDVHAAALASRSGDAVAFR